MLPGYQVVEDWMGQQVLTLADIWPEHPRAVVVGLNPSPTSVAAGHYYQGRTGRLQLDRLSRAGLFATSSDGYFEDVARAAGVGFTDLAKRPTTGERGISPSEIAYGRARLEEALRQRNVPLVICVFRHPAVALLRGRVAPGFQNATTSWGARVFRMPGPYQERSTAQATLAELAEALDASPQRSPACKADPTAIEIVHP